MQVAPFRKVWRHQQVVDAVGPEYTLRTYLEQSDLRAWLCEITRMIDIRAAAEVGAGYGRLTSILTEFAERVMAFEREPHFIADIQRLLPQVEARRVMTLSDLPVLANTFQCVLTFTVLQHLDDKEVVEAAAELKRVTATPGFVLICEMTDPRIRFDENDSPEGGITIGRPVSAYQRLLAPLKLIATAPRRVEPTYRHSPGTYMLFCKDS